MIDELNNKYNEFKGVIDVLPTNTKYNRKRKMDYILEEETKDNKRLDSIKKEIESRIGKFDTLKVNNNIEKLEKELEKCNIVSEWNIFNTSYEKMHLDYYLYQLHKYYKEDLISINACIKKILESFKKVQIILTKDDFDFNNYASLYVDKIINNAKEEELVTYFEEIYWKNPDIIKIIEINFKSIYLKYEKKIDRYYENRHNEFLKSHNDSEIYDMRIKLSKQINELKEIDSYLNFQKFINNEYMVSDFKDSDIQNKKNMYFLEDSYNESSIRGLYQLLNEYNILIKFKYLFDDMKDRLDKKDTLKNAKNNALKEISKEEVKLKKLNAKQNKRPLFGKKKNDEKWLFDYKSVLNNVIDYYNKFDDACFNDLVFTKLNRDSVILDVLRLISSNYIYFVNKAYEKDENLNINDITNMFEDLKNYVNNNNFILLNNIALLDEKQMKQLIVDKYNLGHIKLTIDNLVDDNLEKTINDIKNLIDYENIIKSGININDVSLYLEYNKLMAKSTQ